MYFFLKSDPLGNPAGIRFELLASDLHHLSGASNHHIEWWKKNPPAIIRKLSSSHDMNLISRKTLVGIIDEVFYR